MGPPRFTHNDPNNEVVTDGSPPRTGTVVSFPALLTEGGTSTTPRVYSSGRTCGPVTMNHRETLYRSGETTT